MFQRNLHKLYEFFIKLRQSFQKPPKKIAKKAAVPLNGKTRKRVNKRKPGSRVVQKVNK